MHASRQAWGVRTQQSIKKSTATTVRSHWGEDNGRDEGMHSRPAQLHCRKEAAAALQADGGTRMKGPGLGAYPQKRREGTHAATHTEPMNARGIFFQVPRVSIMPSRAPVHPARGTAGTRMRCPSLNHHPHWTSQSPPASCGLPAAAASTTALPASQPASSVLLARRARGLVLRGQICLGVGRHRGVVAVLHRKLALALRWGVIMESISHGVTNGGGVAKLAIQT